MTSTQSTHLSIGTRVTVRRGPTESRGRVEEIRPRRNSAPRYLIRLEDGQLIRCKRSDLEPLPGALTRLRRAAVARLRGARVLTKLLAALGALAAVVTVVGFVIDHADSFGDPPKPPDVTAQDLQVFDSDGEQKWTRDAFVSVGGRLWFSLCVCAGDEGSTAPQKVVITYSSSTPGTSVVRVRLVAENKVIKPTHQIVLRASTRRIDMSLYPTSAQLTASDGGELARLRATAYRRPSGETFLGAYELGPLASTEQASVMFSAYVR